jgi:hypothetical protein
MMKLIKGSGSGSGTPPPMDTSSPLSFGCPYTFPPRSWGPRFDTFWNELPGKLRAATEQNPEWRLYVSERSVEFVETLLKPGATFRHPGLFTHERDSIAFQLNSYGFLNAHIQNVRFDRCGCEPEPAAATLEGWTPENPRDDFGISANAILEIVTHRRIGDTHPHMSNVGLHAYRAPFAAASPMLEIIGALVLYVPDITKLKGYRREMFHSEFTDYTMPGAITRELLGTVLASDSPSAAFNLLNAGILRLLYDRYFIKPIGCFNDLAYAILAGAKTSYEFFSWPFGSTKPLWEPAIAELERILREPDLIADWAPRFPKNPSINDLKGMISEKG